MISKCGGTGSELVALVGAVEFVADAAAVVVAGEAVDVVVGGGGAARFLLPVEQRGEDEEEEEPCDLAADDPGLLDLWI